MKKTTTINTRSGSWPNIDDYIEKIAVKKQLNKEEDKAQKAYHNDLTAKIEKDYKIWQNINPSKVTALQILALAGLTAKDNNLSKANKRYKCCDKWNEQHETLHKLTECESQSQELKETLEKLKTRTKTQGLPNLETLRTALSNKRNNKLLLRVIKTAAGFE